MATRLKTVEFWFPELASVTDNTDTNFTQITAYLPESAKVFRSVFTEIIIQDAEITANNNSRRQTSLQLGSAGYSVVNNTNAISQSGEQKWLFHSADFTAYFNTNWSGSSMTVDLRTLWDNAIGTPSQNWRGATAKLVITYEYEDTSSTHIKTVRIPLVTPNTSLATSKPGTAIDTIPALDTFCPESSKVFRQISLVVQGNEQVNAVTDFTVSWEVDTLGAYTSSVHEQALITASFFRHSQIQTFSTNTTHSFYLWASVASCAHAQAYLVVTYEYNPASSSILNSLMLPVEIGIPAGTTTSDYQRGITGLNIQEANPVLAKSAFFGFYESSAPSNNMQVKVCDESWSGALTQSGSTTAGSFTLSRPISSLSLSRGDNTLTVDVTESDGESAATKNFAFDGYWILNYTSDRHASGVGAHNHTVNIQIKEQADTGYWRAFTSINSLIPPETDYCFTGIGFASTFLNSGTPNLSGYYLEVERLVAEGGLKWEAITQNTINTDPEVGVHKLQASAYKLFMRYPGDPDSNRLNIATSRRFRYVANPNAIHCDVTAYLTYHSIIYNVVGTISGSGSGTVEIALMDEATDTVIKKTTRSGNGAYAFTCYDNTKEVYVTAYEDGTHCMRSNNGYPSA